MEHEIFIKRRQVFLGAAIMLTNTFVTGVFVLYDCAPNKIRTEHRLNDSPKVIKYVYRAYYNANVLFNKPFRCKK